MITQISFVFLYSLLFFTTPPKHDVLSKILFYKKTIPAHIITFLCGLLVHAIEVKQGHKCYNRHADAFFTLLMTLQHYYIFNHLEILKGNKNLSYVLPLLNYILFNLCCMLFDLKFKKEIRYNRSDLKYDVLSALVAKTEEEFQKKTTRIRKKFPLLEEYLASENHEGKKNLGCCYGDYYHSLRDYVAEPRMEFFLVDFYGFELNEVKKRVGEILEIIGKPKPNLEKRISSLYTPACLFLNVASWRYQPFICYDEYDYYKTLSYQKNFNPTDENLKNKAESYLQKCNKKNRNDKHSNHFTAFERWIGAYCCHNFGFVQKGRLE